MLNEWVGFLPAGYRQGQREVLAMMWMSPYHAMTVVRSFLLPKWLGGKPMGMPYQPLFRLFFAFVDESSFQTHWLFQHRG